MGIFDFFKKKKEDDVEAVTKPEEATLPAGMKSIEEQMKEKTMAMAAPEEEEVAGPVLLGVLEAEVPKDCDFLVVIASLRGTVAKGDVLSFSHSGTSSEVLGEAKVLAVGIESGYVEKASNTKVVLHIEDGKELGIRPGYVLHSADATPSDIHNGYITALGETFVSAKDLVLSEEDKEALTLTDCAEIFRLYTWFHGKDMQTGPDTTKAELMEKLRNFSSLMAEKLVAEEVLYCPYSKRTGKPYLFSRVARQGEKDIVCSPPNILVFTSAYHKTMAPHFDDDRFEVKEILNDENKKALAKFFRECICLNGAAGVCILSEQTGIPANMLVTEEMLKECANYETLSNPELMRYIQLMEQIGRPQTSDEETIYKLYYAYLSKAVMHARLLVPVKASKPLAKIVKEGKMPVPKDTKVAFYTMKGKADKAAACLYTDYESMKEANVSGCEYMVKSVASLIGELDCVLNLTKEGKSGCYINTAMFEDMKKYE
ncbi:MAG: hypothetical protein E7288_03400 [Lachnospiraceae bacterium]|nr:hypothetical protein [Lachnospiraceae bacterium]